MKKQAYFKMMNMSGLTKRAEAEYNTLGPLLGIIAGLYGGHKLAGFMHDKPGFLAKLLYMLGGGITGAYAGNLGQNILSGTSNSPIWHGLFDAVSAAKQSRRDAELDKMIADAHEKGKVDLLTDLMKKFKQGWLKARKEMTLKGQHDWMNSPDFKAYAAKAKNQKAVKYEDKPQADDVDDLSPSVFTASKKSVTPLEKALSDMSKKHNMYKSNPVEQLLLFANK